MNNTQFDFKVVFSHDFSKHPNISIYVEDNEIKVFLNGNKLYSTLLNVDQILEALDFKCKNLLKRHLEDQARKQALQKEDY